MRNITTAVVILLIFFTIIFSACELSGSSDDTYTDEDTDIIEDTGPLVITGVSDTSFGNSGVVLTDLGASGDITRDKATAIAVDGNGGIVVAGEISNGNVDFAVIKYSDDGVPDSSFGVGGVTTTDTAFLEGFATTGDYAKAIAIGSDNSIIVAGSTVADTLDFVLVKYRSRGDLDSEFGSNGIVITDLALCDGDSENSSFDGINGIIITEDGKIIVAGSATGASNTDFAVGRYNADGTLDTTFNADGSGGAVPGLVLTDFGGNDVAYSVKIDSNGKIVVAGRGMTTNYNQDFIVARYNDDGTLDTSFDTDGKASFGTGITYAHVNSMAVDSQNNIIVAGDCKVDSDSDGGVWFSLVRFSEDGSIDSSFGNSGIASTPIRLDDGIESARIHFVSLDNEERIIAAGYGLTERVEGYWCDSSDYLIVRYSSDGSLDPSFGVNGVVRQDLGAFSLEQGLTGTIDSRRRILVAGISSNGEHYTDEGDCIDGTQDIGLIRIK